ncbi:DUF3347 domain-containing protein [Niastella sp. OAS944]|uniref:DUF3347 domain-containing protein n=1 Tax=Niastella sp. OAS944 TaxID=2664089 RepID=UPI0034788931|nr:hypothetical protein [Chitinophagaceae bacterium OAS944]
MKYFLLIAAFNTIILIACNNANSTTSKSENNVETKKETPVQETNTTTPVKDILTGYIQLKNALIADNGSDAAAAGNSMVGAFQKFDKSILAGNQKKTYEDVEDDAREHAEHIGKNGGNITHQREHFDMLSKDVYELVKAFNAGQALYQDSCPMYNGGKGATWLSETKEIKNPYFGKKMPSCGMVTEELK